MVLFIQNIIDYKGDLVGFIKKDEIKILSCLFFSLSIFLFSFTIIFSLFSFNINKRLKKLDVKYMIKDNLKDVIKNDEIKEINKFLKINNFNNDNTKDLKKLILNLNSIFNEIKEEKIYLIDNSLVDNLLKKRDYNNKDELLDYNVKLYQLKKVLKILNKQLIKYSDYIKIRKLIKFKVNKFLKNTKRMLNSINLNLKDKINNFILERNDYDLKFDYNLNSINKIFNKLINLNYKGNKNFEIKKFKNQNISFSSKSKTNIMKKKIIKNHFNTIYICHLYVNFYNNHKYKLKINLKSNKDVVFDFGYKNGDKYKEINVNSLFFFELKKGINKLRLQIINENKRLSNIQILEDKNNYFKCKYYKNLN